MTAGIGRIQHCTFHSACAKRKHHHWIRSRHPVGSNRILNPQLLKLPGPSSHILQLLRLRRRQSRNHSWVQTAPLGPAGGRAEVDCRAGDISRREGHVRWDIWKAIQQSAQSFHHPLGTVALGTVLDSNWRIKGLKGIRVVDSSAIPTPPTCHPQAGVCAIAHRAALDIIEADGLH